MKTRIPVTLFLVAFLLGIATLFFQRPRGLSTPPRPARPPMTANMTLTTELAAPLVDRDFVSSCQSSEDGFHQEILRFMTDGTATFKRQYFVDPSCRERGHEESVQKGAYALAAEEAGQLLLMVRNLYDEKSKALTPYFEALIKLDHDRLVIKSSLSSEQFYTATTSSI